MQESDATVIIVITVMLRCSLEQLTLCLCAFLIEVSGMIQMDFKSDRISDFMVYYLSHRSGRYEHYMHIPLTRAESNITDCMPWMVYDAAFLSLFVLFYFQWF